MSVKQVGVKEPVHVNLASGVANWTVSVQLGYDGKLYVEVADNQDGYPWYRETVKVGPQARVLTFNSDVVLQNWSSVQERDYKWIRKWGAFLGSLQDYIEEQCDLARADNAPANAIYRSEAGVWITTDQILRNDVRRILGLPLLEE